MVFGAGGCIRSLDEVDNIYDRDGVAVTCAASLDDESGNTTESALAALDRARADDATVFLYGHRIPRDRLGAVIAYADTIGLPTVTFRDLAAGGPRGAALALSFDDANIDQWYDDRGVLGGARVTLFVTRYHNWSDDMRAELRAMADLGHDVEAHTVNHLRAPIYVEEHGLQAYLDDEVLPGLEALRADGYDPVAFAYPFGARTSELDAALLDHFAILRSVSFSTGVPVVVDPCPR